MRKFLIKGEDAFGPYSAYFTMCSVAVCGRGAVQAPIIIIRKILLGTFRKHSKK